jgi:glycosyltransferase involved in cell wall biosynthesis
MAGDTTNTGPGELECAVAPPASQPMSTLTFSIITCTWNSEPYLAQSIASLLAQDYPHIEYIFVDGGSTDGTIERIHRVERPFKYVTGVRGGISRAMNEGIRLATGDVIAHLHSDDYYGAPDVLSYVARKFDESGVGWLFGANLFDTGDKVGPPAWAVPRYSYARLLKGNFIPHESTFVRRSLFEQVGGFDVNYKYAMDYDLWLRLGRVAEPLQLDRPLSVFREHGGSASSANRMAGFEEDHRIRMRYAPQTPWSLAYHWAHYVWRKRRLKRQLAAEAAANPKGDTASTADA